MISLISDLEIETAKSVLKKHVIPCLDIMHGLESLYFCIASQATPWEKASHFIKSFREKYVHASDYQSCLLDPEALSKHAKQTRLRFHHQDRFSPVINYFLTNPQGIEEQLVKVLNANSTTRENFVREVEFVGHKTFSFWHLCLGGKNLATLDVHVRRQLALDFNFSIDPKHYQHQPRPVKEEVTYKHPGLFGESYPVIKRSQQRITTEPSGLTYNRIEAEMRDYFSKDPRLLKCGGIQEVDLALATTLLWWRGAKREKSNQPCLVGFMDGFQELLPY